MAYTKNESIKETRKTITHEDIFCPICNKIGQLKTRIRGIHKQRKLYYVDHYKKHDRIGGYHGKYKSCCYLGCNINYKIVNHKFIILDTRTAINKT